MFSCQRKNILFLFFSTLRVFSVFKKNDERCQLENLLLKVLLKKIDYITNVKFVII